MAIWEQYRFTDAEQMINFLNGALIGSQNIGAGADVDGLTLIIDIGGGDVTVTFAPAKNRLWTAAEVVAQINASFAGLARVYSHNRPNQQPPMIDRRVLLERVGALTVKSTGTSNGVLGFSTTAHTVAVIVAQAEVQRIEHQHAGATDALVVTLYR
jgi:hypothetical protein